MEERLNLFRNLLPPGEEVKFEGPEPPVKVRPPTPQKTRLDDIVKVKFMSKSIYSFRNPVNPR
jgi:hypothetical protein